MKTRLTSIVLCLACAVLLAACSHRGKTKSKGAAEIVSPILAIPNTANKLPHSKTPEVLAFFENIETSKDRSFAYTSERPVHIFVGNPRSSVNNSYYYISNLRNRNGEQMDYLGRYSIFNPKYQEGKGGSKAPMLDVYSYVNGADTLRIYVNIYEKGELFIPAGLTFAGE